MNNTILIVCRDLGGLRSVASELSRIGQAVVLASDDPRVHRAASQMKGVQEVCFLENIESCFEVAPAVLSVLEAVNRWLSSLGRKDQIPSDQLYWISHCEGGDTTQRIQDGMLLVRSYLALIDRYRPSNIVIVRSLTASWEDGVLVECAAHAGIDARFIGNPGWRGLVNSIWRQWRPLAKEIYFSIAIVAAWGRRLGQARLPLDREPAVAIQLCSPATKHLNQCLPLLKALNSVGLRAVALCWGAGASVRILRNEGMEAAELEGWVSPSALLQSWMRTMRAWRRAKVNIDTFLQGEAVHPHGRLIRGILLKSVRAFFLGEVAHRYRLDAACRRYFAVDPPRALRPWTRVLPQGTIAYRALPHNSPTMAFWQPGAEYAVPNPYEHYDVPVDLVFCTSEMHKRVLSQKIPEKDLVIAGLPWWVQIRKFGRDHSKADSRKTLNIPSGAELYLLFDPGYVLRGYMSPAEYVLRVMTILELARDFPALHLMIKPHPAHVSGILESLLRDLSLPNLTHISQHHSPHHAINAADLLVTKYSTLAIEAMILDVPSISASLDNEARFAWCEDAVEYVFTAAALRKRIIELLSDRAARVGWGRQILNHAAGYLDRFLPSSDADPNRIVAQTILQRLACSG